MFKLQTNLFNKSKQVFTFLGNLIRDPTPDYYGLIQI